ncbi:MAG: 50S ribosomal protein L21 [Bacteroidota bacterium]
MYAVVEIAGHQYKVTPSSKCFVPKLEGEAGTKVEFDKVLLLADENNIKVGAPIVDGVKVEATVLGHVKDDKVIVFKKKRRKGYRVKRGHRQQYTEIEITNIG